MQCHWSEGNPHRAGATAQWQSTGPACKMVLLEASAPRKKKPQTAKLYKHSQNYRYTGPSTGHILLPELPSSTPAPVLLGSHTASFLRRISHPVSHMLCSFPPSLPSAELMGSHTVLKEPDCTSSLTAVQQTLTEHGN